MITLNFQNLHEISTEHGLSPDEITSKSGQIGEYLQKIHAREQGFYKIVDDEETAKEIEDFASKVKGKYKHFVVLGIGGSALGAITIQQSLTHLFKEKTLHVIDNIDPTIIREIEESIDLEQTLFIVITKSGGTAETLSLYHYFKEKAENFVFITDPEKGKLREISQSEEITTFDVPQNVGGRFSVLTPVGLLPAALMGLNIRDLLAGARKMRDDFLSEDFNQNLPYQLATIQFLLSEKEKDINVLFPYAQKLIKLTEWYKQLLAESIGKTEEIGLTPTNALGATDQHSQLQLYNDGPNNKLFIFIEVADLGAEIPIPNYFENVTFNKLIATEKKGTEQALTKNNRPNITIKTPQINEETLGHLFMLFQSSIAFLGEMYKINAFNQPGVELSKKLTKKMLC